MKQKILEYYAQNPRGFTRLIQKDIALHEDILKFQFDHNIETTNFSELAYRYLNDITSLTCQFGNLKKFRSFSEGYESCKKNCDCSRLIKSKKVAESKAKYTPEQIQASNEKRVQTSLEKYGVSNNGQTENAKKKFREFYADQRNIDNQQLKHQETMMERWGVKNPKQSSEIQETAKQTCLDRYGVDNVAKIPSVKEKLRARQNALKESGRFLDLGYQRFKTYLESNYHMSLLTTFDDYRGCIDTYNFQCNVCGNLIEKKMDYGKGIVCRVCHPTIYHYQSKEELELYKWVSSCHNATQSNRSVINPYEIDIYIPELSLGIEYCGLYWHSELAGKKHRNYHHQKMQLCNAKNIRLITIFSDEWLNSPEKVKCVLSNILGVNDKKLNARDCSIVELQNNDAMAFYDLHHLLGSPNNQEINYGLILDGELLSLMSFSKFKESGSYTLTRYCTTSNVRGGASKLFSRFIKDYNPNSVVSYADLRWSNGDLYPILGFKQTRDNPPGYWYTDDFLERYFRFNFRKNVLLETGAPDNLTEWQIMQALGYDRIWDCGRRRFLWSK